MKEVCYICKSPVENNEEEAAVCKNPKCEKYEQVTLVQLISEEKKDDSK